MFEFIRERLPTGYGLGDDGTEYTGNEPNHRVWDQTLREDHEGDVGIFEIYRSPTSLYGRSKSYKSEVQIVVVTKQGDIDAAIEYLEETTTNIVRNRESNNIHVNDCRLINLRKFGKNSVGYQMVIMNLEIKFQKIKKIENIQGGLRDGF